MFAFLLSFLFPAVEGDDVVEDVGGDDQSADDDSGDETDEGETSDDDSADDDSGDDSAPAPKPLSRYQRDVASLRERAQKAEDDARSANAQLVEARRSAQSQSQPSREQQLWQQEEQVLNDPNADDWQKYSVNAARQARHAQASAQNALHRAEDLSDKTSFDAFKVTRPKLYEKYAPRVEEMLKEVRGNGGNASREKLLAFLVGQDTLKGELKTKDATNVRKVSSTRGQPSNVRSDIPSSGGKLSPAEARAKRLENVRI